MDQDRYTLQTASDAVTAAITAGLLRPDDHPWHTSAGCHPAEEAMDRSDEPPAFYASWLAHMAQALTLCAVGRGVPTSVEWARKHGAVGVPAELPAPSEQW